MTVKRKKKAPRLALVTCETPASYRWLRQHVRGATVTADGFLVTDEGEWAASIQAAGGREI